ncbi:MAG: hypothetical protein IJ313_01300 [Clostridia bacterium]|nr:hypothetical protein [Clostridia bacterium]
MREEEIKTLEEIRRLAAEKRDLEEQRVRLSSVYRSPSFGVMPKGGGDGCEIARKIDAKDRIGERITAIDAEIERLTANVSGAVNELPAHLYALVSTYYLSAISIGDTCRVMGKTRATFFRHQRELREWGRVGNET